jgi:DNA-binding MarR family transcriptional regulator
MDPQAPEDLGWALGVLTRSYRDLVNPVLGDLPHGSRGYQALSEVVHGDQPSQLALAHRLGIDRTVMTYLVDDLEAAGLVERRPNPHDRRQRQVVATDHGRAVLATMCTRVEAAEQRILAPLAEPERALFRRLLNKAAGEGDQSDPCEVLSE